MMPSASYLKRRFPVGTKYVIESCGPFVRRHIELPSGERIRLSPRKALTCRHATDERDEFAPLHSITSSARLSNAAGMVRPSDLAVVRLMTNSNLVGCSTGTSLGFVPRTILSTNSAARRNKSA
jgi:hypothetical protein